MIISYKFLSTFFKEKLPKVEDLMDKITLHAFEVEDPKEYKDDFTFEVKVTPDRGGDALSHFGIARECAAILNLDLNNFKYDLLEDKTQDVNNFLSVEIKNDGCIRYSARVLTGVQVKESPEWLKEKLNKCGISSINNVVDATNYVMLELGQPLHAYDYEKLSENKKIIIEKAKKGEKFITLSNQEVVLDENILTIRDEKDALVIAGIKGGKKTEIDETTKAIVLEAANFEGAMISKASKKIKIRTDSSFRFEHNIDPELTVVALDRVASLIQEMTGAKILKGIVDAYNKKEKPRKISLDLHYVDRFLGIEVPLKEVKRILRNLGFEILKEEKNLLQLLIPTFRKDITIEENLVEEIGRIYGYEKIKPVLPLSDERIMRNEDVDFINQLELTFKELCFTEVYNYPFLGEEYKNAFNLSKLIEVQNPITVDSEYLVPSLIPNLIKNLKLNLRFEKNIKIYEIGNVFKKNGSFSERRVVSGVVSSGDYLELKGCLEELFKTFNINNIEYISNSKESFLSQKKSAIIKVNKKEIGVIGYLSGYVLESLDLNIDPVLFEIDFESLRGEILKDANFVHISNHPIATRDISVIVPDMVFVQEVIDVIKSSESKLIKQIDLLDTYINSQLKTLTFRIYLQSSKKGLENKEINEIQDKIINKLTQNPEWEIKK
ncbi:MAG: phenylalanine--tRNA ligase subunit beta [Candidatus Pacebacteria bacterium]|nr:phenylalanine--tRNA ligase subunit beta [Candidatus Paceibacterota bacterium]MDD3919409.1 phenylalanine--tRNA ligase subunit beta [Candidatus Paceibacterota bacterium]